MILRIFLLALTSVVTATAQAPSYSAELTGKLVAVKNKMTAPLATNSLASAKYIVFYFGAGWCGPCHRFTPDLVRFYNEMKPIHPDFEVVFVSQDTSAGEMQNYMAEMSMPWPAVRWDAVKFSKAEKLCGPGIPDLVVVNDRGDVISDSFEGKKYLGPQKVLNDVRNLLSPNASGNSAVSAPLTASPATKTPAPDSPSGTNWDQAFKKRSP